MEGKKITIVRSLEGAALKCGDFLPCFLDIPQNDCVKRFTAFIDFIDWSKADAAQAADLSNFIKRLILETEKKDSRELIGDDNFIDFYSIWGKLIEKCREVPADKFPEMRKLADSLANYPAALKGGYLREYVMADRKSLLVSFEESVPNSEIPSMANKHRDLNVRDYEMDWKEKVFDLLKEINKNPKAASVYDKVLDFSYKSAQFAKSDLLKIDKHSFRMRAGSSWDEMLYVVENIIGQLEQLKTKFNLHGK